MEQAGHDAMGGRADLQAGETPRLYLATTVTRQPCRSSSHMQTNEEAGQ